MSSEKEQLAEVIGEIVEELRMSGSRLADKLGVDRSTVSRWASGTRQPNSDFVRHLNYALEEYLQDFSEKSSNWQSRLNELHLKLLEKEWPSDEPFTKSRVVEHISERDEEWERARKRRRKKTKGK